MNNRIILIGSTGFLGKTKFIKRKKILLYFPVSF